MSPRPRPACPPGARPPRDFAMTVEATVASAVVAVACGQAAVVAAAAMLYRTVKPAPVVQRLQMTLGLGTIVCLGQRRLGLQPQIWEILMMITLQPP